MVAAKSSGLSFRAKRSVVEESLIPFYLVFNSRDVSTPLDMTKGNIAGLANSPVISDRERGTNFHRALCGV